MENFEQKVRASGGDVDTQAQNYDRALSNVRNDAWNDWLKSMKANLAKLDDLNESSDRIEAQVSIVRRHLADSKGFNVLVWTSTVPHMDNHKLAWKGHVEGNGSMIFEHRNYKVWEGATTSTILWLHGSGEIDFICHRHEDLADVACL